MILTAREIAKTMKFQPLTQFGRYKHRCVFVWRVSIDSITSPGSNDSASCTVFSDFTLNYYRLDARKFTTIFVPFIVLDLVLFDLNVHASHSTLPIIKWQSVKGIVLSYSGQYVPDVVVDDAASSKENVSEQTMKEYRILCDISTWKVEKKRCPAWTYS